MTDIIPSPVAPEPPSAGAGLLPFVQAALFAGLLFSVSRVLLVLPCWGITLGVLAVAMVTWRHLGERALFRRRIILAPLAIEGSFLHRMLMRAWLAHLLAFFSAVISAAFLLAVSRVLTGPHWIALACSAIFFPLLQRAFAQGFSRQLRPQALDPLSRHSYAVFVNVVLLMLIFLAIDMVFGARDTRGLGLIAAFTDAYHSQADGAACGFAGDACGLIAGVDAAAWHLREIAIPALPDATSRLAAWVLTLLGSSLVALTFSRFLAGATMPVRLSSEPLSPIAKGFFFMIAILAVASTMLQAHFAGLSSPETASSTVPVAPARPAARPCAPSEAISAPLHADFAQRLDAAKNAALSRSEALIRSSLRKGFAQAELRVDGYLDWYYSVLGEYERLAAMAGGSVANKVSSELLRRLFDGQLDQQLTGLADSASREVMQIYAALAGESISSLREKVKADECIARLYDAARIDSFERDLTRAGSALTAGVAAGSASAVSKAGAAAAAKLSGKKFAKHAAAFVAKMAAKKGAGAAGGFLAGSAICSPGGPLALVCGGALGVATWIGADALFISIDEYINREEMRQDILTSLAEMEREIGDQLIAMQRELIANSDASLRTEGEKTFSPIKDGL